MRFLGKQISKRVLLYVFVGALFLTLSLSFHGRKTPVEPIGEKADELVVQADRYVMSTDDAYRLMLAYYVIICDKKGAEEELAAREAFWKAVYTKKEEFTKFKKEHIVPLRKVFTETYTQHCPVTKKSRN